MTPLFATLMMIPLSLPVSVANASLNDLNDGFPNAVEDATPTGTGDIELQVDASFVRTPKSTSELIWLTQFQWGFLPNFHAELNAPFQGGAADQTGSGDLQPSVFYNPWKDRLAFTASLNLPTGKNSAGADPGLKGIFSTPLYGEKIRAHFNYAAKFNTGRTSDERRWGSHSAFGFSQYTGENWLFIEDITRDVDAVDESPQGIELGVVHQTSEKLQLALSCGRGIGHEARELYSTFAFQYSL